MSNLENNELDNNQGSISFAERKDWFWSFNKIFDLDISIYAKTIYLFLCRCADSEGKCFPAYQYIALKCGMSKRKAITTMKELTEIGLVKAIKKTRINEYGKTVQTSNDYLVYKPTIFHEKMIEVFKSKNTQKQEGEQVEEQKNEVSKEDKTTECTTCTTIRVHDMHHIDSQDAPEGLPIEGLPIKDKGGENSTSEKKSQEQKEKNLPPPTDNLKFMNLAKTLKDNIESFKLENGYTKEQLKDILPNENKLNIWANKIKTLIHSKKKTEEDILKAINYIYNTKDGEYRAVCLDNINYFINFFDRILKQAIQEEEKQNNKRKYSKNKSTNKGNENIPQANNFEQRKYTDEQFDSFVANGKKPKKKEEAEDSN